MNNFDDGLELSTGKNPYLSAFLILFFSFIGATVVGGGIGLLVGFLFFNGSMTEYMDIMNNMTSNKSFKISAYVIQGVSAIIGFIVVPVLFMIIYEKKRINQFFIKKTSALLIALSAIIAITFTGFNSWFVEWNANVHFPEIFSAFETYARDMESRAMEMTKYLTEFESTGIFILAFIVIAVVPGIGEELVFRGFLQKYFHKAYNNIHIAIWASAIMFSAIHLQFFGFIPRMLLGALFGYLYYWSGNLIIPIVAHMANNGFMILMMYLYELDYFETNVLDMENLESVPFSTFAVSGVVSFGLIYYFRKLNIATNSVS
ncbi:MAG: CPBP family intramembrane metalloprotease [Cyclobacteriaceae bacterium]|nr:CPBP family intramembrane metalloprotease [Cyclobacteriaceae bacterium]